MELAGIKGVGPKTLEHLNKLNIFDTNDLIRFYPYRYNIYTPSNITNCNTEETIVITGIITSAPKVSYIKRNFNRLSFTFETNNIPINVVIFNRAFYQKNIVPGKGITLIGKYNKIKNTFTASDIKFKMISKSEVEPVYHMVNGISSSTLSKLINSLLNNDDNVCEIIPDYINNKYELMNTMDAIRCIHNPVSLESLKKAKLKLKYEELFEFMFKINLIKYKNQIFDDFVIKDVTMDDLNNLIESVPFTLTNDQINALKEILNDFNNTKRMNRLILGDVGSGKTIVAFLAILLNSIAGYQSALLSPTEVLANQHYENFINLFGDELKVGLLTGSLKASEKKKIIEDLRNGDIDLLIGTHAMLEENVEFNNIGLVVTDEQHRFGVNQRKCLQNKGNRVDVLYMSATPIPRTYALTIYGDMDISMIKEKPKGRKDIITNVYNFKDINNVCKLMEDEINNGHQVYVVAPLIESEDGDSELNDLKTIEETLNKYFKNKHNIGILHGKMKNALKDEVMNSFKEGILDILISTTVIEVGVDVKNATIMAIFNAERFGLATLHQLRGRVGRSDIQSYCMLLSDKETERLHVMEESNDGFYISEKDFEIRGSGDLFGTRQSGDMIFKIADLRTDYRILLQCKKDAEEFIIDNIENDFRNYKYYKSILNELINND